MDRRTVSLAAGLIALALLFATLTGYELRQSHDEAIENARLQAQKAAGEIAEDASRLIETYDSVFRTTLAALALPEFDTLSEATKRQVLFSAASAVWHVAPIAIADPAGHVILNSGGAPPSPTPIADREYFRIHAEHPNAGLYLSTPFKRRNDGEWAAGLSRRITARNGGFGGIVFSPIHLSGFREMMDAMQRGTDITVTLLNGSGVIFAAMPWDDAAIGHTLSDMPPLMAILTAPGSTREVVSPADGVRRIYSVRPVQGTPLLVSVAASVDGILGNWRSQAAIIGGASFLTTIALLWLALSLARELTRRRLAERAAHDLAMQFRVLTDNASDMIHRIGLDGVRRYVSPAAEAILGYAPQELTGRSWRTEVHPQDSAVADAALAELRAGRETLTETYRCLRRDGTLIWLENRMRLIRDPSTGEPAEIIAISHDVTAEREAELELAHRAATDPLTGIANRRTFDETLAKEWRRALRLGDPVALIMIDADCFKLFNDRYGHAAGDDALRMIASKIEVNIRRPGDLAARYGGEEFVAVLPGIELAGAIMVAEKIRSAVMAAAMPHAGNPAGVVTVSLGVAAACAGTGETPSSLVGAADAALYAAKAGGRNRVVAHGSPVPGQVAAA